MESVTPYRLPSLLSNTNETPSLE